MSVTASDRLASAPMFASLPVTARQQIAAIGDVETIRPSHLICEKGAPARGISFVLSGQVKLLLKSSSGNPTVLDILHEGTYFGDESFQEATPLLHAVWSGEEETVLFVIPRDQLNNYLEQNPEVAENIATALRLKEVASFLSECPALAGIPRETIMSLSAKAGAHKLEPGATLIEQGKVEDHLYMIKSGRFVVNRTEAPSHRLAMLGPSDIVGEMAVISGDPRTANVVAESEAVVYEIEGADMRRVLAEENEVASRLGDLMKVRITDTEEREEKRQRRLEETKRQDDLRKQRIAEAAAKAEEQNRTIDVKPGGWRDWIARRFHKPASVLQHSEMDCSAACLCTVIKHYGKTISINSAREVARVRQDGASMANVIRAAEEFGFVARAYTSTFEQLREETLPAIANWRGYHWVVVHKVTDDSVIVADPAQGVVTYSRAEFEESWSRYTIYMEPTERFNDIVESKPTLGAFWHFYKPHKRLIGEIFVAALFLQVLAVLVPLFSKFVVDDVIMKGDQQWLMAAIVVMSSVSLINMLLSYIRDEMTLRLTMRCNLELIGHIYDRMLRLPIGFFEARKTGDITNRLEQHEEVTNFITEDGLETFLSLMTAITYLCFMLYFNAWLTFAAIGFMFFDVFIIKYISPRLRQLGRESFVKEAEQESHLIESIRGSQTLKTTGSDFMARWKYENNFAAVANMEFKQAKLSQFAGLLSGTLDSLGDIAVLFLGGAYVIWGDMTIGELIAFTVFANGVQGPIGSVLGKWDELQETYVAIERLNDILDKEPEMAREEDEQDKVSLPTIRGDIEFRGVAFRYEPDDPDNVVQNVNLKIEPGEKVAFVGASGCGKSTLIKLLYGFYPLSSGEILVDGFKISEVSIPSLRRQIAMIPQNSLIFSGTIRDNIALARPTATMDEIREASKMAEAHDFIMKMPGGYDAKLAEEGSNLSGGQRQRLAIARALLQPAGMLVMDEATSALDNETERTIMNAIMANYKDKTILMIAHRLSTIRNADKIVVLNNGIVAEVGSHDELIEKRALYYQLTARQLSVE